MRIPVKFLSISAAMFIALAGHEYYTDTAIIPTKNDVPTMGFGSTVKEDGTRVKMGDTITPVRAVRLAGLHLSKEEQIFRASIADVALTQVEYDLYMDFVYQYGSGTWGASSMRRHLNAGHPYKACESLLLYKYSGGYDCSTPGNKICAGVWTRQLERHKKCTAAVSGS